jgi:hypothetical protein
VTEQEITDALKTLKSISDSAGVTRVYLSAVDASSYAHWGAILDSNGFQVIESQIRHDDALILPRRTDDTDMLVDFFSMAGALRVLRLSYSDRAPSSKPLMGPMACLDPSSSMLGSLTARHTALRGGSCAAGPSLSPPVADSTGRTDTA